jgi:hypothetical protein
MRLNLAHYSMGFLELISPDRVELRGSGTLVRAGKTYGILTAAHVWRTIREFQVVGFYLYPPRKKEVHSIREDVRLLDAVTFENTSDDEFGPDIAFVRLTDSKAASIEKHGAFLNLEKDEQKAQAGAPDGSVTRDIVAGGVEALGQKINMLDDRKLVVQNSLAHVGHTNELDDGRNGFDRFEFIPEPDVDYVPPHSYGGMSGGGCFRVYFPRTEGSENDPLTFHLLGVPFFETNLAGKADKIICHGRGSLTDKLLPAVRAKWPSDV